MKDPYANVTAVGMDVHYRFTTVTMRDANARVVRRERLDHRDDSALRRKLKQWPAGVPIVLEASFGWAWLTDLMLELGLRPQLSNCWKLKQMRKARGWAKTNKKDADLLSLLPFEAGDWWKVWMAPPAVRDRRERMRHRSSLVAMQTGTKNRISGVLHRHGILHEFTDLFGVGGRRFLVELCRAGGTEERPFSVGAWTSLQSLLSLLDHVRWQLAGIARELRGQLDRSPLARRLDGIPGIGLILAYTLMAEIGQIERFESHRALASYSLLAPIANDTGDPDGKPPLGRRLGQRGNRTLKWAFIEAAHGAVRSGGKWRRLFDSVTEGGRRNRTRGYIKVARELVKVVYVVWSKQMDYTDTPPARPGRRVRSRGKSVLRDTRSGTGQPCRPMAAVR